MGRQPSRTFSAFNLARSASMAAGSRERILAICSVLRLSPSKSIFRTSFIPSLLQIQMLHAAKNKKEFDTFEAAEHHRVVRFSIVTPSYRSSAWLRLCVASVADQAVESEHIVQDAGSDDGTLDWAQKDGRVKMFMEKDLGMYDAVNRGLRRASG